MKKKRFFYLFLVLFYFSSCKETSPEGDSKIANMTQEIEFPNPPEKAFTPQKKQECKQEKALKNLGKIPITMWEHTKGKYVKETYDLSNVSGNPIKSPYISSVLVGYEEERRLSQCENTRSKGTPKYRCQKQKKTVKSEGESASICSKEFKQDDLENHILAAVYTVESTFSCVEAMGLKVNPLKLRIYPNIYYITDGGKEDLKKGKNDNAFWSYSKLYGDETLNFLSHTFNRLSSSAYTSGSMALSGVKDKGKKNPLDYQFILNKAVSSHEASHHIFDHFTRTSLELILTRLNIKEYETHDGMDKVAMARAMQQNKSIFQAFSEFGADALAGVCNPNNSTASFRFTGKENEKVLTEEKIRSLLGRKDAKEYASSHTAGSIIDNTLKEFWQTLGVDMISEKNNDDVSKAKKLLFQSLKNFGSIIPPTEPREYLTEGFFRLIQGGLKQKTKGKPEASKAACKVLASRLPGIIDGLKEKLTCEA